MADLSQLSDEQLGAYRDLLARKQAPGVPKPPLPDGLAPGTGPGNEDQVNTEGNEPGLPAIVNQGIHQLARAVPAFSNGRIAAGTSDVVRGAGKVASPLLIPAAIAAPAATTGAAVLGTAGHVIGEGVADAFHASPETSEAVGDVASVPSAILGGRGGSSLTDIPASRWLDAGEKVTWNPGSIIKAARTLFAPRESAAISQPSVTGGYERPDYSNLIQMPGHGVPPYESPVPATPRQPGPQTDFGAHVPNYGNLIESPSVAPPPVPSPQPEAEVPHPRVYVSTRGAPVAPWNAPQGRPSSGTGKGQPYVGPTSFNAAPKVTPGAIPELMRQQRLQSGDVAPAPVILDPGGRPIGEPPTFANGGIKNNVRRK